MQIARTNDMNANLNTKCQQLSDNLTKVYQVLIITVLNVGMIRLIIYVVQLRHYQSSNSADL